MVEGAALRQRLARLAACNIHLAAALLTLGLAIALHHPGLESPIYSDIVSLYLDRIARTAPQGAGASSCPTGTST